MGDIVIASNNAHKIEEIKKITGKYFTGLVTLKQLDISADIAETGTTFTENAVIKAKEICRLTGLAAVADDSGLCVDALGGAPGIYSARFAGDHVPDAEHNALLLKKLEGTENRKAKFICAVAICFPDGRIITAEGFAEGEILYEERGRGGFGYDPLFYSYELKKTFAEAGAEEKNAVSHRACALKRLEEKLGRLK